MSETDSRQEQKPTPVKPSPKEVYFNGEPIEKSEIFPMILGALWALMPPILLILATFSVLLWIIFIR